MIPLLIGIAALLATVILSTYYNQGGEISFWEQFSKSSDRHK